MLMARPASPLAVVFKLRLHRGSLAVQLDRAGKNTLHRQSSINATHHDFGHLVDKLPNVFLALARDRHFIFQQQLRQRDLVVDEIFLSSRACSKGYLGCPFRAACSLSTR